MFNEFFNELANNPGKSQGGFLFFLDWANHNLNSVRQLGRRPRRRSGARSSTSTAKSLPLLKGVAEVNPNVNLLSACCKPPDQGRMPERRASSKARSAVAQGDARRRRRARSVLFAA